MASSWFSYDLLAIGGYSLLLLFSLYKLLDTVKRPVDLAANLLLVTGLSTLVAYHVRRYHEKVDINNDADQYRLRMVAHASLTAFFVLTLTAFSKAAFQFYDWFALGAHSYLFVAVWQGLSQVLGAGLLALYFLFAAARKAGRTDMEMMQFIGRVLMLVFFVVDFMKGVHLIA